MKLSYPVVGSDSDAKMLAFCGDFERNLSKVKMCGYEAIELLVCNPKQIKVDYLHKLLGKYDLKISAMGTGPMQAQDKLTLLNKDEENRKTALKRCLQLVELASHFNAPVCIGKFRGDVEDEGTCTKTQRNEVFAQICNHGVKHGVKILLEPQKQDVINNLNSVAEALSWLDEMNCENLELLLDTYHMYFTEKSICDSLRLAKDKIGLIHASDSDRLVPGGGILNYHDIIATIKDMGYKNYVSLEIKQFPSSETVSKLSYYMLRYFECIL